MVKSWKNIFSELLELFLAEIQEEINGLKATDEDRQKFHDKFWDRPEFTFFLTVWGPCLFFNRTLPHDLYKKAIIGDFFALETLIKLDQQIIHEKKIRAVLTTRKAIQRNILHRALDSTFEKKPEKRNLKQSIVRSGALISLLAQIFKFKLSYSEILKLFDAISTDYGRNGQETCLYDDVGSFGRAVRKEKSKWLSPTSQKKTNVKASK